MIKKVLLLILILFFSINNTSFAAENPRWVAQPIYVYIPDYGNYSALMRRAFKAWEEKSDELVRFKFVSKPSNANINVMFVDHVVNCNSELAVGCSRMKIKAGKFYASQLEIAMKRKGKNNSYRPINNIYGVMLHEIGHALGLGHSNDKNSIMYSYDLPTLQYLTPEDMRLLYKKYH